jgi:dGTPase
MSKAHYAADASRSRGRLVPEAACPMRTPFQRDRDRIVHATAFRRLTYKTQVFVYHEGDHYRTRLTHSLEVAQIARAIARLLQVDEDLAEALALAHDLGHPPFGHAGERALDRAMAGFGGFDHNAQSLKVVTKLERKYAAFDGLNLSFETLEGLAGHNGPVTHGPVFAALASAGLAGKLDVAGHASLEAQAAAIADDIAYTNHDIDDGLRAGLLNIDDLVAAPLVGPYVQAALALQTRDRSRAVYEVNRRLITAMIDDAVTTARAAIADLQPRSAADVAAAGRALVAFSEPMARDLAALKAYLFTHVYRHARVMRVMEEAATIVRDLVALYLAEPERLPPPWNARAGSLDGPERAALIRDFVAGMTDRYAIGEHRRLFPATPELR